jgi:hypothetical protein
VKQPGLPSLLTTEDSCGTCWNLGVLFQYFLGLFGGRIVVDLGTLQTEAASDGFELDRVA